MPYLKDGVLRRRRYKKRKKSDEPAAPITATEGWSISVTPARAVRILEDMKGRGVSGVTAWVDVVLDKLERDRGTSQPKSKAKGGKRT